MRLHVTALDSTLVVDVPKALAAPLLDVLDGTVVDDAEAPEGSDIVVRRDGGLLLVTGGGQALTAGGPAEAVEHVLMFLNQLVVEQCQDIAVHAGVVGRAGSSVAFPAVSGQGKSTLTAACLQAGWEYVSDEALVLDDEGRVRPYPKPLSLLRWTLHRLELPGPPPGREERPVPARELQAGVCGGTSRLSAVLLLERSGTVAALTRVTRAEAAVHVLRHSFNHYRDRPRSLRVVAAALRGASAWRLSYGDPVDAAALLTSTFDEAALAATRGR